MSCLPNKSCIITSGGGSGLYCERSFIKALLVSSLPETACRLWLRDDRKSDCLTQALPTAKQTAERVFDQSSKRAKLREPLIELRVGREES